MSKFGNKRNRLLALIVIIILASASVAGFFAYQVLYPSASCANPLAGAKVLRTQLSAPTTFGGITTFSLPTPIREPSAPLVASDGSVWFADQAVGGLAHFYPVNRTLVEYAWPYSYLAPPSTGGLCGQKSSTWGMTFWNGKVWLSDTSGNQLVSFDPSTAEFSAVKLPANYSFPYTLTPGPGNTLWFTELFTGKIGVLSANLTLHEFSLPGGVDAEPSQIVFANSTTGYYSDVGASESGGGGIYSFQVSHFAPLLVGGQRFFDPSSLTLGSGAIWVALHGSSSVAVYNFTTKVWSSDPTSFVVLGGSATTTLPYFVQANGSEVWVNEHYGNRMALIDPANGSLTEYSESNQAVNENTIGNALTFGLGGGRAWFAEETGNVLGYANASYSPGFYTGIAGNTTVTIDKGSSANVTLVVHDTTHQGELNLTFADSETLTAKPVNLTYSAPSTSISLQPQTESHVLVSIAALQSLKPGTYYAILTATDGLTYESSFLKIVVPS